MSSIHDEEGDTLARTLASIDALGPGGDEQATDRGERLLLGLGIDAFELGNYAGAWRILEPLALDGQAVAAGLLGIMAFHGLGRASDWSTAFRWLSHAREHGMLTCGRAELAVVEATIAAHGSGAVN